MNTTEEEVEYESTPMHRNGDYLIDDYAIPNLFTTDKARFAESLYYTEIDPCYLFCYVYNGLWQGKRCARPY